MLFYGMKLGYITMNSNNTEKCETQVSLNTKVLEDTGNIGGLEIDQKMLIYRSEY